MSYQNAVQRLYRLVAALVMSWAPLSAMQAHAASDYQWAFTDDGGYTGVTLDYILQSVSSPDVYDGALGAGDPVITLQVGKRYEVTVVDSAMHPFQVLAKAGNHASDVVLLAMGTAAGSLEADAGINWVDNLAGVNGKVEFTVTQGLAAAMMQGGRIPGYRCAMHSADMRGNFTVKGLPIANPIPAALPKGDVAVELETVASGLVSPLGVLFLDDGSGRALIFDQVGVIRVVSGGSLLATPFLDISARLVALSPGYDERGLLGAALHPAFAANGRLYTYTSEPVSGAGDFSLGVAANHQSVVAEWVVSGNPNLVDTASRREILRIDQPQSNHNAGAMHFGPDGLLYIALGDGGGAHDTAAGHGAAGNGQNINTIHGSIIRIDVDGGGTLSANGQYGIPAPNPFVGTAGVDEIFAYGFRNPYAFSFDAQTGELYAADVGQGAIEEVNIVIAGGNYGWRVKEGSFYFNTAGYVTDVPQVEPVPPDLIDPIAEYDHDEGLAVVGGFVVRNSAVPGLDGRYVFGDFATSFSSPSGRLFYLAAGNEVRELQIGADDRPLGLWLKGFGQDHDGAVYVCGSGTPGPSGTTGVVLKLVAVDGGPGALAVGSQSSGQWIAANHPIQLYVTVRNATPPVTYQWYKDGDALPLADAHYTGVDSDRLVVHPPLDPIADSGAYWCVIEDASDGAKTLVTTQPIMVQVFPEGALPVAGLVALTALGAALALAGARRRR